MPQKDRQDCNVSRDALADLLMADEHRKATEGIRIAENRLAQAIKVNSDFERGRENPTTKIGLALAKQAEDGSLDNEGEG